MEYKGKIRGGVVVLEPGADLPEGTEVKVEPVTNPAAPRIWDKLLKFAGSVKGLPPDAARNHDHYLYGTPKK